MTIFFSSDHHFGHANIITFCERPFNSVDHMTHDMVARWNEVVSPEDEVYYLGDFAMGDRFYTVSLALALNGRKVLIPGNHDHNWKGGRRRAHHDDLYLKYFDEVIQGPVDFTLSNGTAVVLNHFPGRQVNDRHDRKFSPWEYDGDGWVLHGHTHSNERINREKQLIHVGVDAWDYRPVAETTIINLLEEAT